MRKIIFKYETGSCGSEGIEYQEYPDDVTEEQLNNEAWVGAVEHAAAYGIYPDSDLESISEEDLAELEESGDIDNYSSGIEGWWEDYDPEKHDMLKPGGGTWE
jgi:hypothetical protein